MNIVTHVLENCRRLDSTESLIASENLKILEACVRNNHCIIGWLIGITRLDAILCRNSANGVLPLLELHDHTQRWGSVVRGLLTRARTADENNRIGSTGKLRIVEGVLRVAGSRSLGRCERVVVDVTCLPTHTQRRVHPEKVCCPIRAIIRAVGDSLEVREHNVDRGVRTVEHDGNACGDEIGIARTNICSERPRPNQRPVPIELPSSTWREILHPDDQAVAVDRALVEDFAEVVNVVPVGIEDR
ncbi:hypothetical protein HRbin20_00200 [bacterium HR20]|nr:hypothetical protein HRbin20_00200 [bacterium HR20]